MNTEQSTCSIVLNKYLQVYYKWTCVRNTLKNNVNNGFGALDGPT